MNSRTELMIGVNNINKYSKKHIAIFGVGGVGGYVLEGLVRSGFEKITIFDFDKVDLSNLNRQIISNINNIDKIKIDEAIKHTLTINPNVDIIYSYH